MEEQAMDREMLRKQLEEQARQMVERLATGASPSRQDMAAMEQAIYAAADAFKAQALQAWVDAAADDSGRPPCPQCGGTMRQKEQKAKTSVCVGGAVTVKRTRWWCSTCRASFFPSGPADDGGRAQSDAAGGTGGPGGGGDAQLR
jgi:uncharacterized protein with PIN domain